MSFAQVEFLWLMLAVLVTYWGSPTRRGQNVVLLVASALFYGWIHPWWLILLVYSAVLDYHMGQLLVRSPRYKKLWLGLSIGGNVVMLMYFKYFGFFVENVGIALEALGVGANVSTLAILLPAGISFYTFQTMSYTIDIYRGELEPRSDFLDYLVFVSFFPQLVAGPIERAARLLPQLEVKRTFELAHLRSGFALAMWGLFKKVVVADTLAPYIDKIFLLTDPAAPLIWMASAAYMVQLYADFSGYTDIARGTSRMLGIDLVRNFDEPYMAATTPEMWQRWHMSLSSWVRDYILTPLLDRGDVITFTRFVVAVSITMVVMGAWHGAGWNFILFGFYHAFWITLYVAAERRMPARLAAMPGGRGLAVIFHTSVVSLVSVLIFREPSVARLFEHLTKNPFEATPAEWQVVAVLAAVTLVFQIPFTLEHHARRWVLPRLAPTRWYLPVQTVTWSVFAVLVLLFRRPTQYDFIYFQF